MSYGERPHEALPQRQATGIGIGPWSWLLVAGWIGVMVWQAQYFSDNQLWGWAFGFLGILVVLNLLLHLLIYGIIAAVIGVVMEIAWVQLIEPTWSFYEYGNPQDYRWVLPTLGVTVVIIVAIARLLQTFGVGGARNDSIGDVPRGMYLAMGLFSQAQRRQYHRGIHDQYKALPWYQRMVLRMRGQGVRKPRRGQRF
ncbi:hypothetical protein HGA91_02385 [candidate division WWE3 bacterium]|nr:hypothetical protein [candidate division WWE3 bacterium]